MTRNACSASGSAGAGSGDAWYDSTNGTRSRGPTVNSAWVRRSFPSVWIGVRSTSPSGPATARIPSRIRCTHGTIDP